jgi:formate hydrogenlyase subunit 3/multisubunit Na+/H+ antiporter MnhD subunit
MNSSIIWIGVPLLAGLILVWIPNRGRLVDWIATTLVFLLAILAMFLPIETPVILLGVSIKIGGLFSILGRSLEIYQSDMPLIALIFGTTTFWFISILIIKKDRRIFSFGLMITALLIAALAVEPFIYAALFIELAVIASIPILISGSQKIGSGIIRYIIFQTLAVPFLMLSGYLLSGFESGPYDPGRTTLASISLGIGFAFVLGIFPFYSWIPMLTGEESPIISGFVLILISTSGLLFGLTFFERFAWLRESEVMFTALRTIGILMVFTSGVWCAFQKNFGKVMGYMFIHDIGFSLLAISLNTADGYAIFNQLFIPRILALGMIALTLTLANTDFNFRDMDFYRGTARSNPLMGFPILTGFLSMSGFPLLASFPLRLSLLEKITAIQMGDFVWIVIGMGGMLFFCITTLGLLFEHNVNTDHQTIPIQVRLLLIVGCIIIFVTGLFPGWYQHLAESILITFPHLL